MNGTLYIVATPIGNLQDITLRALEILKTVDLVACEDTRRTKILLERYQISKPLVSYHQHSRLQKVEWLIGQLQNGKSVAAVSDAGTPGISDPGGVLVAAAVEAGIAVVPIAGPSALAALVSVAGLPMDRFRFYGFVPHKKGRQTLLEEMLASKDPSIFYESPHRILKTLEFFADKPGRLVVGRELTKKFEEIVRGTAAEVAGHFKTRPPLGEYVVLYAPA